MGGGGTIFAGKHDGGGPISLGNIDGGIPYLQVARLGIPYLQET